MRSDHLDLLEVEEAAVVINLGCAFQYGDYTHGRITPGGRQLLGPVLDTVKLHDDP